MFDNKNILNKELRFETICVILTNAQAFLEDVDLADGITVELDEGGYGMESPFEPKKWKSLLNAFDIPSLKYFQREHWLFFNVAPRPR